MSKKKQAIEFGKISKNVDIDKAMKEKEVLYGLVVNTQKKRADQEEGIVIQMDGHSIVILKSEVGILPKKQPISSLVGHILSFIIVANSNNVLYGSHSQASKILAEPVVADLKAGKTVKGVVRSLQPHGAYVSIAEGYHGLINNSDCYSGLEGVKTSLKVGQVLDVVYKGEAQNGRILLEMVRKDAPLQGTPLDDVYEGMIVFGIVTKVTPTCAFSSISNGCDVMTAIPSGRQIAEGKHVCIEIVEVDKEKKNVRGVIKTVID